MEMKKLPILIVFLFILSLINVIAVTPPPFPMPVKIFVNLNNVPIDNIDITVKNLNYNLILTPDDVEFLKTEKGVALFDLSKFDIEYYFLINTDFEFKFTYQNIVFTKTHKITSFDVDKNYIYFNAYSDQITVVKEEVIVEKPVEVIVEKPVEVIKEVEKEIIREVPVDETAKDPVSYILGAAIAILASILGLFTWGKGFEGILKYWAKKDPDRALKMVKTIVKNYKEGKYKK